MYLLQLASGGRMDLLFALWPLAPLDGEVYFHLWQLVTYAFLHDTHSPSHLLFNMLGLWMFGAEIERYVGPWRVTSCYFASLVTAAPGHFGWCLNHLRWIFASQIQDSK